MTVLLTGATGFLGSRLAEVIAARHELRTLKASADPADAEIDRALSGCGAVAHLAALKGGDCTADPAKAEAVNVGLTRRLLAASERARVRSFLFASSYFVHRPVDEYAKSKLRAEAVVKASAVPFTIARIGSVFAFDKEGRGREVVAAFVRSAVEDNRIEVSGDGTSRLDLVDREDVCRWLAALLEKPERLTVDVGRGEPTTLRGLAELVAEKVAAAGLPKPAIELVPRSDPPPPDRSTRPAPSLGPARPLSDSIGAYIAQYLAAR